MEPDTYHLHRWFHMIVIMSRSLPDLFANGKPRSIAKGAALFHASDPVRHVYFVVEGQVDLVRHGNSGRKLIFHSASMGQVLAEASVYASAYHCDGIARQSSRLLSIAVRSFHSLLAQNAAANEAWARYMAHGLQRERLHSELRTLKTVSARLDGWLDVYGALPPKGHWQDLAHTLGVSREALYRELARRN